MRLRIYIILLAKLLSPSSLIVTSEALMLLVTWLHSPSLTAGQPVTVNLTGDVTVLEGDSVSISCFSTGNPVPTITWYLGTSVAPFPQNDTINHLQFTITIVVSITNGDITSRLMIENAAYPAHEGEYTCVGLNSNREGESTNNATINVQVRGKHIRSRSGILLIHHTP